MKSSNFFTRVLLAAGFVAAGLSASAKNYYWSSSYASGDWDNAACWGGSGVPGAGDAAIINPKTAEVEISVNGEVTCSQLLFGLSTDTPPTDGALFPRITLKGPGKLTLTANYYAYNGRQVRITDGLAIVTPDVNAPETTNLVFEVANGASIAVANGFSPGFRQIYRFLGGSLSCWSFSLSGTSEMTIDDGGLFRVWGGAVDIGARAKLNLRDGTFHNESDYYFRQAGFLPQTAGGVLLSTKRGTDALDIPSGPAVAYVSPGTLLLTNAASTTSAGIKWTNDVYYCGGKIYADRFEFAYPKRCELDVRTFCLGKTIYPGGSHEDARLEFHNGVTLGAFGNWKTLSDRTGSVWLHGPVVIDTDDCFGREVSYDVTVDNLYPTSGSSLEIRGAGTAKVQIRNNLGYFDKTRVVAGSTLNLTGSVKPLVTRKFEVESGATLLLKPRAGAIEVVETPVFGSGAIVRVSLPASPVAGAVYPVLSSCAGTEIDISGWTIADANPGDWRLKSALGRVFLTDRTDAEQPDAVDWTSSGVLTFTGGTGATMTNPQAADVTKASGLSFGAGGPFTVNGERIVLTGDGLTSATTDAVYSSGTEPATINAPIKGTGGWMEFYVNNDTYMTVNGDVSATGWGGLAVIGDVRLGGQVSGNTLYIYGARKNSRATTVTLLPGAEVTLKAGSANGINAGSLRVMAGSTFRYTGGSLYLQTTSRQVVDGLLDVTAAASYLPTAATVIEGTGTLAIARTTLKAGYNGSTTLGGGVTLRPGARWATTASSTSSNYCRLAVGTYATIALTNDFVYGPAEGVETTTTVADRALRLPRAASRLTVDTAGHTARFEDPITGYGRLTKTGEGVLDLTWNAQSVTGGVTVAGGTLAWSVAQDLSRLTVRDGATLAFGSADGEPLKLTVASDLDLTGVAILPRDAAAEAALGDRGATVVEAVNGAKLSGMPVADDDYRFRIVDGTKLQIRPKRGLMLLVR